MLLNRDKKKSSLEQKQKKKRTLAPVKNKTTFEDWVYEIAPASALFWRVNAALTPLVFTRASDRV